MDGFPKFGISFFQGRIFDFQVPCETSGGYMKIHEVSLFSSFFDLNPCGSGVIIEAPYVYNHPTLKTNGTAR